MERERFEPDMRVRTVKPHLVTANRSPHYRNTVIWHGRVSHLSSEQVGAVWVVWDRVFCPYGTPRPVQPEMICREAARATAL